MKSNAGWRRPAGLACLIASLGVLFFQQTLGQYLGVGVMALWLGLGGLGVWLVGPGSQDP